MQNISVENKKEMYLDWMIQKSILALGFFLVLSPMLTTIFLLIGSSAWLIKLFLIKECNFKRTIFDIPIACFAGFGAISVFASLDTGFSFYNFYNLMGQYVLVYYLFVQNISTMKQIKQLIIAMLIAGIGAVGYGFYQYIHGIDITSMLWVDGDQFPELKTRVFSTMQNPNIFAGYLLVMLSMFFGVFTKVSSQKIKSSMAILFILFFACLTLTYCRGAILSLALVLAFYGIIKNKRLFFMMIVAGLIVAVFDTSITERIMSAFNADDSSSQMRMAMWESTVAMIIEHPIFGVGWGSYFMVYPYYDFFINNPDVLIVHAHNMYLNIAAEIGLLGFMAFCSILFGAMHMAFSKPQIRESQLLNGLMLGFGLALACIAVNGFTDYVLFNIELSMLFWIINAFIVIIQRERLD